jgi:hypothetical protein
VRQLSFVPLVFGGWLAVGGCQEDGAPAGRAPQAAVAAAGTGGLPPAELAKRTEEAVAQATNPKGLPAYSGPVGTVKGVVTLSGDPAPIVPEMVEKLPAGACPRAHDLQRKLFRQGLGGTLADALVTVTEYEGYVVPQNDTIRVEIKGCAFDGRVLAMMFGQHFDVFNLDAQAYLPRLVGTPSYALRVAMPGGNAVPIFAPRPGEYLLVDQTRDYVSADVFVLSYPTFDVTGLDGRFEISGVPVGDVKVSVYAPAIGKVSEQRVKLEATAPAELSFQLQFSEREFQERKGAQPGKSAK